MAGKNLSLFKPLNTTRMNMEATRSDLLDQLNVNSHETRDVLEEIAGVQQAVVLLSPLLRQSSSSRSPRMTKSGTIDKRFRKGVIRRVR